MNADGISIRNSLRAGDIGYIVYLHGYLYQQEYGYGIAFETYVASGLLEFQQQYDPSRDGVWICEHEGRIVGSLFLVNRGETAQLRYFILCPGYRGIGLGHRLLELFMEHLNEKQYRGAYLWTTDELAAAAHLYTRFGFRLTETKASAAFGKKLMEQRYDLRLELI
ncbi:MAG: GNAT family N-acetyltransferase [Chitinophagaceae bacterium]|nr:GNAT family N-acetyltransferase [Chitinophagaceae bacterium]